MPSVVSSQWNPTRIASITHLMGVRDDPKKSGMGQPFPWLRDDEAEAGDLVAGTRRSGTSSTPPFAQGWQRAMRQVPSPTPLTTPCC